MYVLRIAITRGSYDIWTDIIYSEYQGEFRPLEDDIIQFWGTVVGRKTYTTVMGSSITLPEVDILTMQLLED